jgi:hypothetical protein
VLISRRSRASSLVQVEVVQVQRFGGPLFLADRPWRRTALAGWQVPAPARCSSNCLAALNTCRQEPQRTTPRATLN